MDESLQREVDQAATMLAEVFHLQVLVELGSILAEHVRDIPYGEMVRFLTGYNHETAGLNSTPVFDAASQVASDSPEFRGPVLYVLLFDLVSRSVRGVVDFIADRAIYTESHKAKIMNDVNLACLSFKRMQTVSPGGTIELLIDILQERGMELSGESRQDAIKNGEQFLSDYWGTAASDRLEVATRMSDWMRKVLKPSFAWMSRQKQSGHRPAVFLRWLRDELREQFLASLGFASFLVVTMIRQDLLGDL